MKAVQLASKTKINDHGSAGIYDTSDSSETDFRAELIGVKRDGMGCKLGKSMIRARYRDYFITKTRNKLVLFMFSCLFKIVNHLA